jgi:hypothetical protein
MPAMMTSPVFVDSSANSPTVAATGRKSIALQRNRNRATVAFSRSIKHVSAKHGLAVAFVPGHSADSLRI